MAVALEVVTTPVAVLDADAGGGPGGAPTRPRDAAGAPAAPDLRHHRSAQGGLVRAARRRRGRRRWSRRSATSGGSLEDDVHLVLGPAAPLRSPALRDGHPAGRRTAARAGPLRPRASVTDLVRRRAAHHDLLRPDAPAPAGRPLGGPAPRLGLPAAARPRRGRVPARPQGVAAGRRFRAGHDLGVLRLDRGPVHRVPQRGVGRAPRHGRAGPARAATCAPTPTARCGARSPTTPGSPTWATRSDGAGLARGTARAGVHRRRPRPDRRGRLRLPRRAPRGPHRHRRRQRLPGRGRAGAGRHPGVREVAVYGVPDPEWGERVCAAVVGEADPDAPARVGARAPRAGQAAQGLRGLGRPADDADRQGPPPRAQLASPIGADG